MATDNRPTVFDGAQHRPMTDAELAQHEADQIAWAEAEAQQAAAQAAALEARKAPLRKLGLTDDEINIVLGL